MSVLTPERPPELDELEPTRVPPALDPEALIEEARQRARLRRLRILAGILAAGVGALWLASQLLGAGTPPSEADVVTAGTPSAVLRPSRNGPLTILTMVGDERAASIVRIGSDRQSTLWRCPTGEWCGEPVSHAWAPDGRRVAVTLDEIGGQLGYPLGLHVIDVVSGRDVQIPANPPKTTADATKARAYLRAVRDRLGCWPPTELAWSPDGTRLAYRCPSSAYLGASGRSGRSALIVLSLAGTGHRVLTAGFWPSWSPDGTRIVYATRALPGRQSSVYSIAADGSDRRLLARAAAAPAWSPDGRVIAYHGPCGVRLVTPDGVDVTPNASGSRCRILPSGRPMWSPDGRKLAIATDKAVYVVGRTGASRRLVLDRSIATQYGNQPGRPSWRPTG